MIDSFETRRLVAARLQESHFPDLCRLHRDAVVMATLLGVRSDDQTRAFLDANLRHWDEYGFGLWMFHDKATRRFVGRAGLRRTPIEGVAEVELAYALMAAFWNQGLATEIATTLVRLGFEQLGLGEIVCFTLATNIGSQRVMQKAGFVYERDFLHMALPHVLYRRRAPGRA